MRIAESCTTWKDDLKLVKKRVGQRGTEGIVCGTHAITGGRQVATLNASAKCMDYILRDFSVNALASKEANDKRVYVECTLDGKTYACDFDGTNMSWEGHYPQSNVFYLPILLYAVQFMDVPELKSLFDEIVEESKKSTEVNFLNMLMFCDSFYHDVLLKVDDKINVIENAVIKEPVKRAFHSGYYGYASALEKVTAKPVIDFLLNLQVNGSMSTNEIKKRIAIEDWEDILAGRYILPYEWSDDMKQYIPPLSKLKEFHPVDEFFRIVNKIMYRSEIVLRRMDNGLTGTDALGKDYVNGTLSGNPGTGKTTILFMVCAALGLPVASVSGSKNTDEDLYQGMNKFIDGRVQFIETDFLKFFSNGGLIILEEVNLNDPGVVMGALGQAVEFPFILKRNGYETVTRHPLCFIFSTKNINTYGSRGVNQAFSNRFANSYLLNDPKDEDFIKILEKNGFKKNHCEWVFNAYKKVTNYLLSPTVADEEAILSLSMRTCIAALQSIEEGILPKVALADSFVGKIAETDIELAKDIKKTTIDNLPSLLD